MGLDRVVRIVLQLGFIWGTALSAHHEPTDLGPGAAQFFQELPSQPQPNPTPTRPQTSASPPPQTFSPPPLPSRPQSTLPPPPPPPPPPSQPTTTVTQMSFQPSQPSSQLTPFSSQSSGPIFDGRFNTPVTVVTHQPSSSSFASNNPAPIKSFFEVPIPFTREDPKPFRQPLMVQVPDAQQEFYLQPVPPPNVVPFQHNVDYRSTPPPFSHGEPMVDEVDSGQETHTFYY